MPLSFIPFDESDAHFQLAVDIHNAHWKLYPQTVKERRVRLWTRPASKAYFLWFIHNKDNVVGMLELGQAEWSPKEDKFELALIILPEYRGNRYGSRALRFGESQIRQQFTVNEIETESNTQDPESIAFFGRRGFVLTTREIVSVLDLAEYQSRPGNPSSCTLQSYRELLQSDPGFWKKLYSLHIKLEEDVPWHDQVIIESIDNWIMRRKSDPVMLLDQSFVALDQHANYVGASELFQRPLQDSHLSTGLTGVLREHRRRGLARALKDMSLSAARDTMKTADGKFYRVLTENEVENPMFLLNESLGFQKMFELYYLLKSFPYNAT